MQLKKIINELYFIFNIREKLIKNTGVLLEKALSYELSCNLIGIYKHIK